MGSLARESQGYGLPCCLSAVIAFLFYGHGWNWGLCPVAASAKAPKDTFDDGFAMCPVTASGSALPMGEMEQGPGMAQHSGTSRASWNGTFKAQDIDRTTCILGPLHAKMMPAGSYWGPLEQPFLSLHWAAPSVATLNGVSPSHTLSPLHDSLGQWVKCLWRLALGLCHSMVSLSWNSWWGSDMGIQGADVTGQQAQCGAVPGHVCLPEGVLLCLWGHRGLGKG